MLQGQLERGMVTQSETVVAVSLVYSFRDVVEANRFFARMQEHLDAIDVEADVIVLMPVRLEKIGNGE